MRLYIKWQAHWWGTVIRAENEDDNEVISSMIDRLDEEPEEKYSDGELDIEIEDDLMIITFNR